jgi:hypothetical protein
MMNKEEKQEFIIGSVLGAAFFNVSLRLLERPAETRVQLAASIDYIIERATIGTLYRLCHISLIAVPTKALAVLC